MAIETLYSFLKNDKNNLETALLIQRQLESIRLERGRIFDEGLKEGNSDYFQPFKKKYLYDGLSYHLIFDSLKYEGNEFKLNINFYTTYTEFDFYEKTTNLNIEQVKQVLDEILGSNKFTIQKKDWPNHYSFNLCLDEENTTLNELDNAGIRFAKELFQKFKAVA